MFIFLKSFIFINADIDIKSYSTSFMIQDVSLHIVNLYELPKTTLKNIFEKIDMNF